jgi:hypothetical protein
VLLHGNEDTGLKAMQAVLARHAGKLPSSTSNDLSACNGQRSLGSALPSRSKITQEGGYEQGSKPAKATTTSVNHALRALKKLIADEGLKSVALPRLATGVGGLDWGDVQPLVRNQLGDAAADIYVYQRYVPGKQAEEPKR